VTTTGADKIFVVDDDADIRKSLARVIAVAGWDVETLASAEECLERLSHDRPACIVLDVRLPGLDGLALQERLVEDKISTPVVCITGHGDVPMSVRAMKSGAVDFLLKPLEEEALLDAVQRAAERDRRQRQERDDTAGVRARVESLTPREREVFDLVVSGLLSKQVAAHLGISEHTVKVHRGRIMKKMSAESIAGLVGMAHRLASPDSH
jgi:RNA polymerase sigma factor (sigma-70 family)